MTHIKFKKSLKSLYPNGQLTLPEEFDHLYAQEAAGVIEQGRSTFLYYFT
jgi:hypothetical protein